MAREKRALPWWEKGEPEDIERAIEQQESRYESMIGTTSVEKVQLIMFLLRRLAVLEAKVSSLENRREDHGD